MNKGLKKYIVVGFLTNIEEYCGIKLSTDCKEDAEQFADAWNRNSDSQKYYVCENFSMSNN